MNRNRSNGTEKFLFWFVYVVSVGAAWWGSFNVFLQSEPWFVAALAATSIDGALAFVLYLMGRASGSQRNAALVGTVLFFLESAIAQVINRFYGMGVMGQMPEWLSWVSLGLFPAATSGSVLMLGLIKYFDRDNNGIPDFMERQQRQSQQTQNRPKEIESRHEDEFVPAPQVKGQVGRPRNGSRQITEFAKDEPTPKS